MELNRRKFITVSSCAVAAAALIGTPAYAALVDDAIAEFTGGVALADGAVTLTAPEIAENGNSVPVEFSAPGAVAVAIFADGNPEATIVKFKFGPLNPSHAASTRVRLAQTQNVIMVAQMEDGSFQKAQTKVKVTIGGCGG